MMRKKIIFHYTMSASVFVSHFFRPNVFYFYTHLIIDDKAKAKLNTMFKVLTLIYLKRIYFSN